MSDTDIGSDAWVIGPGKYLQGRVARHQLSQPSSCYVTMRDGCRLALDTYVPAGTADSVSAIFRRYLLFRRVGRLE